MGIENSTLTSVVASSGIKSSSPEIERARTERINHILSESSKSLRRSRISTSISEKKKTADDDNSSDNLPPKDSKLLSILQQSASESPEDSLEAFPHIRPTTTRVTKVSELSTKKQLT
jgi:hypothetical protein